MSLKLKWENLRVDLKKHIWSGLGSGFICTLAFYLGVAVYFTLMPATIETVLIAAAVGTACGIGIGWAKEYLWDVRGRGVVDRADFLFTGRASIYGAVCAAAILVAYIKFS